MLQSKVSDKDTIVLDVVSILLKEVGSSATANGCVLCILVSAS